MVGSYLDFFELNNVGTGVSAVGEVNLRRPLTDDLLRQESYTVSDAKSCFNQYSYIVSLHNKGLLTLSIFPVPALSIFLDRDCLVLHYVIKITKS